MSIQQFKTKTIRRTIKKLVLRRLVINLAFGYNKKMGKHKVAIVIKIIKNSGYDVILE